MSFESLLDWVLQLEAEDLPSPPWKLSQAESVLDNETYIKALQREILKGPNSARAKLGSLQREVITLWNLLGENYGKDS